MTDITFAVVTDAVRAAGTPADGRIVITSDTKSMYVGDGSTLGGNKIGPSASSNNFSTISVSGQSDVVADQAADTLTLIAGTNITLATNATNDSVTITASASAIADNSLSLAKLVNTTQYKLLGRSTASTGSWEEVTTSANTYSLLACADYSAMRTAMGVQPVDATLTALTSYNTDGLLTQTAADTFVGRTITGTANEITLTNGNGVAGNPTISLPADVLIPTILTVPNSGLHILDTNASHDLIITPGSNLTADRILTVTTGDAARTVTINADTTISGTNTGDQTITLSSDVTGTGTGSFATTIAAGAVTYAKMQNISATDKVLGRVTAGAGSPEEIACTAAGRALIDDATAADQRTTLGVPATTAVVGRQVLWVPSVAIIPSATGGCAALTTIATSANHPDLSVLDFDGTTVEYAQFGIGMPNQWDEGTVTYQVYWTVTAAVTTGVVWQLQAVAVSNDDTIDAAYGTAVSTTDTALNASNDMHIAPESSAITIAGTPAAGDMVYFRINRLPTDGGDTMSQDARLVGVKVFWTQAAGVEA